jgi:hypothetical protein
MKTLSIKTFEQAAKAVAHIKELDAEIIEIERFAISVADGETSLKLNLEAVSNKPAKQKKEDVLDEDGSLRSHTISGSDLRNIMISFGSFYPGAPEEPKAKKNTTSFKSDLPDTVGLQMLGVLLAYKIQVRDGLIRTLQAYSIDL